MIIANAEMKDSERVSVLASALSSSDRDESATKTNEEFLQSISYKSVASFIKQCEGKRGRELHGSSGTAYGGKRGQHNNGRGRFRKRMTKEMYEHKTIMSPSAICSTYGHWKHEHLADGSLPAHVNR